NPCRTLSDPNGALAKTDATRNYIRMEVGNYTETNTINLQNNMTIEGGYVNSGGLWNKTSNTSTRTNITSNAPIATATVSGVTVGHRTGIASNSASNWKLIDINLTTNAVSGATSSRGNSNYAVWINNSSNYEITRCNITAGNAGNGADGEGRNNYLPTSNWDGNNGTNGMQGTGSGTNSHTINSTAPTGGAQKTITALSTSPGTAGGAGGLGGNGVRYDGSGNGSSGNAGTPVGTSSGGAAGAG